jgi:hypothetical protein
MSKDPAWGEETVALGREAHHPSSQPKRRQDRTRIPRLPRPTRRMLAPGAFAIAALAAWTLAAWIASSGGGSESGKAPIREIAEPAPHIMDKPPRRMPRREPRTPSTPRAHRRAADPLEGKRGPKSAESPEPAAPVSAPAPVTEQVLEPASTPAPEAPPPTSSAAEFGM